MVASFRKLVGATNPLTAEPGTIRGDFGRVTGRNIVHASDSPENGIREAGAQRWHWMVRTSRPLLEPCCIPLQSAVDQGHASAA